MFFANIFFILKKFKKKVIFFFFYKKIIFIFFKIKKKKKKIKKKLKIGKFKEIKISINIDNRDYLLKIKKTIIFLKEGYNVKISIFLKGRQILFKEKGIEMILNFQNKIKEVKFNFSNIEFEGKTLYSIFTPKNVNKIKKNKIFKKKIYYKK